MGGLRPDPGPGQDGTGGPVTQLPSAVRSHPEHSGWRRRRDAEQEPWHPIPACGSPPRPPQHSTLSAGSRGPHTSPLVFWVTSIGFP